MDGVPYITDSDGNPSVFNVERNDDDLWLNNNIAHPTNKWNPKNEFVFRLRKYSPFRVTKRGFSFRDSQDFFSSPQASCRSPLVSMPYLRIVCSR